LYGPHPQARPPPLGTEFKLASRGNPSKFQFQLRETGNGRLSATWRRVFFDGDALLILLCKGDGFPIHSADHPESISDGCWWCAVRWRDGWRIISTYSVNRGASETAAGRFQSPRHQSEPVSLKIGSNTTAPATNDGTITRGPVQWRQWCSCW